MALTDRLPERFQPALKVAPVRPAYAAGFRAAMATVAPLIVGYLFGEPEVVWASLAGFSVSLTDRGGPYGARAAAMGSLLVAGAVAAVLAGLTGASPWTGIPLLFLVATLTSLGRVYSVTAGVVGSSIAVVWLVSMALPAASLAEALGRGLYFVLGALWAMALSLVLWPINPYRPARLDVALCYRVLSTYASSVAGGKGGHEHQATGEYVVFADRALVRETLEAARATLVGMRRGRQEGGRGERLLVLLEIADQSFATLLALGEVLDSVPPFAAAEPARDAARRAIAGFASTLQYVARIAADESRAPPPFIGWSGAGVRAALSALDGVPSDGVALARAAYEQAARLLDQLGEFATAAGETAATLEQKAAVVAVPGSVLPEPGVASTPVSLVAPLREALSRDSVALMHALRVGITTTAAALVASQLGLSRGYWVTLTVLVVLQPQSGATFIKAVQRVVGTVLGGVIAAAIALAVHDTWWILAVVFVLATVSVAVLPINYAVFSMFLTPTFVLLAEVNAADWHLANLRIVNTLIGGVLALLGTRLLWPRSGRAQLEGEIATSLARLRDYLATIAAYEREAGEQRLREIAVARREVGLAALNAEATFQWRLGEAPMATSRLEPVMAVLTYTRRLAAAATALTTTAPRGGSPGSAAVAAFAAAAAVALDDLSSATAEGRLPAPLPAGLDRGGLTTEAEGGIEPLLRAQLVRAGRQLATLHSALTRIAGGAAAADAATMSRPSAVTAAAGS